MRTILFASVLMLAACQGSPPAPENVAEEAGGALNTQNQIADLADGERNGVFIRAIRDAGQDCQFVESSEPAGSYQDFPMWHARCDNGRTYTIVIANGGEAQVIDGAVAAGNTVAPATNQQGE